MTQGQRIKEFRHDKGMEHINRVWTQQDLAVKLGVAVATVSRWEADKAEPSGLALDALRRLGYNDA